MLKYAMIIWSILPAALLGQNPPVDSACIPAVTIHESQNNICMGTAVTFSAAVVNNGTGGVYKWKKNNLDAGVNSNANYTSATIHDSDVIMCEYSCKTACGTDTTVVSNPIILRVINDIIPNISVANNDPLICQGEITVFTTTAYYGNAVPSYQWLLNGNPVGTNSPVFSTSTITNGAKVQCVLTISTPSCQGSTRSDTGQLTIYVYPLIHPIITITPSRTIICRGEEVIFTATANGGAYPTFAWEINGMPTGADTPVFKSNNLKEGDSISCTVTIDQDSRCHTSTSAPSNKVAVNVQDFIDPTLRIVSEKLDVCEGKPVTFTATPQNAGNYQYYQWQINGKDTGPGLSVFVNDQYKNGDTVSCNLSTNIEGCPITVSVASNKKVVTVKSNPVITFSPPEISIMAGEQAKLQAAVTGTAASVLWTPGGALISPQSVTSATVPLWQDTVFNLAVVDINGCKASNELLVKVLHKLYMPSSFTPNDDGKNDVFRIPPRASISLREFLVFNRWGQVVFKATDVTKGWNGTSNGEPLDTGAYIYVIKGIIQNKEVMLRGTVILQR